MNGKEGGHRSRGIAGWLSIISISMVMFFSQAVAQLPEFHSDRIGISAGMGVNYHTVKDIVDRINGNSITVQRVSNFKSGVEFFGAVTIPLSPDWVMKIEYSYLLASYTQSTNFGPAEFSYHVHMPTLLGQYILHEAETYNLKLGAGAGYHLASYSEKYSTVDATFTGSGIGTVLELEANTALGEHLFAHLGTQMRWDFIGELTSGAGKTPGNLATTFNFFSAGVRIGMSYYF